MSSLRMGIVAVVCLALLVASCRASGEERGRLATVTPTPEMLTGIYVVVAGDSLSGICSDKIRRPEGMTVQACVDQIKLLNSLRNDVTDLGQELLVPQGYSPTRAAGQAMAAAVRVQPVQTTAPARGSRPPCDTSQSRLYCIYTIQPGDTLSSIAAAFGLKNVEVLAADLIVHSNYPAIQSADDLPQVGQKIRIPMANGVIHTLRSGETASTVAEIYDVALEDIASEPLNGITDFNALVIGQELLIPDPRRFAAPVRPPTGEQAIEVRQSVLLDAAGNEVGRIALYFRPNPRTGKKLFAGYEASTSKPMFCYNPDPNFYPGMLAETTHHGTNSDNPLNSGLFIEVQADGTFRWAGGGVEISGKLDPNGRTSGAYNERPYGSDTCASLTF